MAVTFGDLCRSLSVLISHAQSSFSARTLQEQTRDAPESIPSGEVEEWGHVPMVDLCCEHLNRCENPFKSAKESLKMSICSSSYSTFSLFFSSNVYLQGTWGWCKAMWSIWDIQESQRKMAWRHFIDLFVMATSPSALFNKVKDQSHKLMKPSVYHIMSWEIMESLFVSPLCWIMLIMLEECVPTVLHVYFVHLNWLVVFCHLVVLFPK